MDTTAQEHLRESFYDDNSQGIWRAAYAAAMVRQIFDYLAEGLGSPDDDVVAGFREEAVAVADMILGDA